MLASTGMLSKWVIMSQLMILLLVLGLENGIQARTQERNDLEVAEEDLKHLGLGEELMEEMGKKKSSQKKVKKSSENSEAANGDTKNFCTYVMPSTTGSPCPNGYIQWNDPKPGFFVSGYDILAKAGMTLKTCQDLCWTYAGCVSIDLTTGGVCYLNYQDAPLSKSPAFTYNNFSCCKKNSVTCQSAASSASKTGPCYSNSAKFIDYVPGKFISGYDLKVLYSQTVDSCRTACWNTPFCKSADITREGVCYLNFVSEPATAVSGTFSFIGFECCDGPAPTCDKTDVAPTGGPCPNGYVKWKDPTNGFCVLGNDIAAKGGMNIETCRAFCLSYPGCVGVDLFRDGTCYANSVRSPVSVCSGFMTSNLECCSNVSDSTCVTKEVAPTGSPCPSGGIKWNDPKPTLFVSGQDIVSKGGMTMQTCQDLCWTYPGCVSADIYFNGVCYLNSGKTPTSTSTLFTLMEFECCNPNPAPLCKSLPSKAGSSGPCYSGSAKFLDYQPGKYIYGYDLNSAAGHNVTSCRQWCWDTVGCQSADITNAGVCYLNSVRTPVSTSPSFSFIDIECCAAADPVCEYKEVAPTGGPCPNGFVKWSNPNRDKCQWGNDIASKGGLNMDQCRDLCLTYPGCVGVDLTTGGVCYINSVQTPLTTCVGFTNSQLECCSNFSNSTCETKDIAPTGSPCPSGRIKWNDPKPTAYVYGQDIIAKSGMTMKTCQDLCWTYPGCVSADIYSNGMCYLNSAKTPAASSSLFSLMEFECCGENVTIECASLPSKADNSGPCYSGSAKFLDYQPGKFIIGYDLKSASGHTVSSCRQWCWDTVGCKSADITNAGLCYLNSVRAPLSTSPLFSFIDFECCAGNPPTCQKKNVAPTGGPCANGYVKWAEPKTDFCQYGNDIASKAGMTIESCRDFCLTYPGCVGADITTGGVCYVNSVKTPLTVCKGFTNLDFECCSNISLSQCVSKDIAATGSPCPSGNIRWKDAVPGRFVPGQDLASKAGMTMQTCQDFCWTYPGCVSADITYNGVCYLNYAKTPTAASTLFSLMEFECCNPKPAPVCDSLQSTAGTSGPCYSGSAKFLDYQPGKYIIGNDLKVATGQTVESCRLLCWNTANCQSADITNEGVCYLNRVKFPISTSPYFSFIDFDCCPTQAACVQKAVTATGSPCSNGYISWADPKKSTFVPGNDIISKGGMTIETCRDFCWSYAGCVSADLTTGGVCYLNYATTPLATSDSFSLLEFECCNQNKPATCESKDSLAGGSGPCDSGVAKFVDYQPGKYVIGYDIKVAYSQTVATCRQLCWDTPWCKSADITSSGICYLNRVKGPLATSGIFSFIDFECCSVDPVCEKKAISSGGSICPTGYIKWAEPKQGSYVPGYDLDSKAGMTRDTCRDFCWSRPGCVSADLTIGGVCYLNYAQTPILSNADFVLLTYDCCPAPTVPQTTVTKPTMAPTPATTQKPKPLPTAPPCTKETTVDITFVVDSSGSIGASNFEKSLKPAVKGIINYMLPGPGDKPSNSRVACVSFSDQAYFEWGFTDYSNKQDILTAVDNLPFYDSTTATGEALNMVRTQIHPTVRPGVTHLIILITDGDQNVKTYNDTVEAAKLKDLGDKIFAVGVGSQINKANLDIIASGPAYRADVKNYNDLKNQMMNLAILTCNVAKK